MSHAGFVHLRVHTAYSLAEGAIQLDDLIKQCVGHKMPAVAMTDNNNMFAALEFSTYAAKAGVQPIIGLTLPVKNPYVEQTGQRNTLDSLVLLAQNEQGYKNLMKLTSNAHLYSAPEEGAHATLKDVKAHAEGVICLTGGVSGPIGRLLLEGQQAKAEKLCKTLIDIFGDRLYMEIQRHGMPDEEAIEEPMLDMAYTQDVAIVATNEPYFTDPKMYEAHDTLLCIADGTYVAQTDRRKVTPQHWFKSSGEMANLFEDLPEAIANTLVIAKRCAWKVNAINPLLPNFAQGSEKSEADILREMSEKGLEKRLEKLGDAVAADKKTYEDRLKYELEVIEGMGFPGYFLIVADFIQWSKDNNIPVGPGRGSGAGSVVAWALKITDLDPLRFGLLFERFLNPERISMPDFDIDFCQDKRERVIRYVQEKYGMDHVAQIITFGKLQARAVVKACGRVLQQPYPVTDRLSKLIPNDPGSAMSLRDAINSEPRLQNEISNDDLTAAVMDRALKLEGLFAHSSTHAAGVVIGDRPLDELVPLYRDPKSDMPVTQFNMKWVEQAGLVKFDFLGLKTLTVIDLAVQYIKKRGIDVSIEDLPLDDKATFTMLSKGDAAGVFQLESAGMRSVLKGLRPDTFEDIIAIVALYRPGPMANIPTYVHRKHNRDDVAYDHPMLEDILEETYGVIIYQEQVMQIAQTMSGYNLGEADLLRRAMGKKIKSEMDQQRGRFVKGAVGKGVEKEQASYIFDLVTKFAEYGFNKSHAAAYALVAYQTAYLKANYPVEFMAAIMTLDLGNTDKLAMFKQELNHMDIPLLLPDINKSYATFTVENAEDHVLYAEKEENPLDPDDPRMKQGVRYALAAIKGVGEKAMNSIVAERDANGPFKDLFDFASRIDPKMLNKRQIENLAAAGAFDCLNEDRAQTFKAAEILMRLAQMLFNERESAQVSLFGGDKATIDYPQLPISDPWTQTEALDYEHKAVGFYISAHPLDTYKTVLKRERIIPATDITVESGLIGQHIKMAGAIVGYRENTSRKNNKKFGILSLSDRSDGFEVLLFEDMLPRARTLVDEGAPLVLSIQVRKRDDEDTIRLSCSSMESLERVASQSEASLIIELLEDTPESVNKTLEDIRSCLQPAEGGRGKIYFKVAVDDNSKEAEIELPNRYKVTPKLSQEIEAKRGVEKVQDL